MSKAKEENSKTLVLLDAHAIIHRAYHALPEFLSSKGEPTGLVKSFIDYVLSPAGQEVVKKLDFVPVQK